MAGRARLPEQPATVDTHWSAYFAVTDTDAMAGHATRLGGSIIAAPWDTPYERMAVLRDDQGGACSVMTATPGGQA